MIDRILTVPGAIAVIVLVGAMLLLSLRSKSGGSLESKIRTISDMYDVRFRPATQSDLEELSRLGMPDSIVEFYAKHEPETMVEGIVRLWPIEHVIAENTAASPGIATAPHGVYVFATNFGGDAYCVDSNTLDSDGQPRIVLVSHTAVGESATKDIVLAKSKPIADNLEEFLDQIIDGEVDYDCIY